MRFVAALLMLLANRELFCGPGLPQVVHGSGRLVLLPPPQPPVAVSVSPPPVELRYADDAIPPATAIPAEHPDEPPRKRGRKKGEDAIHHKHLVKELLVKLVNDAEFRTPYKFCKDESSSVFKSSLERMIRRHEDIVKVMKDRNRGNPELVHAALLGLESLFTPQNRVESSPENVEVSPSLEAVHGAIAETRASTESIFDFSALKRVSDGLNWSASSRLSRDGSSTIRVHDKKRGR
jgi:hypothetical protein